MISRLSADLNLKSTQVNAVVDLLAAGNTVPFIARYRKESTGSLDEVQIRAVEERLAYLRDLEARRKTILESIESQGKLTDVLKTQILECQNKSHLEDLYLPFKPKRRTRAMIAKERGLYPLAQIILEQPVNSNPLATATTFVNPEKEVGSPEDALSGARDIVAEIVAETLEVRTKLRQAFESSSQIVSKKRDSVEGPTKFEQYYDYCEPISQIPSHRFLAIARGERENVLRVNFEINYEQCLEFTNKLFLVNPQSQFSTQLTSAIEDAFKRLLVPSIETEIRVAMKMKSDRGAIEVFAQNLRNILMSAPMGPRTVIGVDPGLRTGCKCAAVLDTGKFVENTTIYITGSHDSLIKSKKVFLDFVEKHRPFAIAIGNGTGGRETEALIKEWLLGQNKSDVLIVSVSESGASVYSASETARNEFPELDLTIRGAISIARRLQDPLAELVKVEPKSMGVGQYQHDVYQPLLEKKLSEVVESCVNHVGVELNTASAPLLSYVAGIGEGVAKSIVSFRNENGFFTCRSDLKKVAGLGPKTFEQAAGFLRINGAKNPLDASAVHPERYHVVEKIAGDLGVKTETLVGNQDLAKNIDIERYVSTDIGSATLKDIVEELKKPGRDPRSAFERPDFAEGINSISDLRRGMLLNGIVTNVTAFGAFVDVGVHQDGLVHISELSDQFVSDPSVIVKAGDRLKVVILDIDIERKRISMSARVDKRENDKKITESSTQKAIQPKIQPKNTSRVTLGSIADFTRLGSRPNR